MTRWSGILFLVCALQVHDLLAQEEVTAAMLELGDAERGRLVFAPCRTCHSPRASTGHGNGPNLNGIFGRVAGKQAGFDYYSETFKQARFVWTPQLMYTWLEAPMKMYPGTSMMSGGIPDARDRADLVAYLLQATARD